MYSHHLARGLFRTPNAIFHKLGRSLTNVLTWKIDWKVILHILTVAALTASLVLYFH